MIQKKGKENFTVDLQTINLIEAGFDFNNKLMARDLVECAETKNLILAEQYGSRKNYRAINQACNKRLLYDLNHL